MQKKLLVLATGLLIGSVAMAQNPATVKTTTTTTTKAVKKQMTDAEFLAENKTKPGVITLPSGLQYKVVTPGKGESPKPTSTVTVDYEGKLINGTVFDSSYARHQSISFSLNQVIPGWTEGVGLMKPGETAILYIPGYLAYGAQGVPGTIPPNATLVFKIHLISVQN